MRVGFSTVFHEKLRICHNKNIHCMRIGTLWVGSAARPLNQSVQMRLGHCWKGKHQVVQRATANFRDPYTLRQEPSSVPTRGRAITPIKSCPSCSRIENQTRGVKLNRVDLRFSRLIYKQTKPQ